MNTARSEHLEVAAAILRHLESNVPLIGAEIGVANGHLSEILLQALPLVKLYMVDLWATNANPSYAVTNDVWSKPRAPAFWNMRYRRAASSTRRFQTRRTMLRMDSVEAAATIDDRALGFAFIDDDHSYEGCTRSITAWWPKIKPGGWLGGHDYGHTDPRYAFHVTEAVRDFFDPREMPIELDANFTWFVRKDGS